MKRSYAAIAVGVIIIVAAILFSLFGSEREPPVERPGPTPSTTENRTPSSMPQPRPPDTTIAAPARTLSSETEETEAEATPPAAPEPPQFDIVRISPDGNVVIAGRAESQTTVHVLNDDTEIGTVASDQQGNWVFVPNERLSPGQHRLVLKDEAGKESDPVLLIVPDESKKQEQPPLAVSIPETGKIRPLDPPPAPGAADLSIDVIQSDAKGDVTISGKGPENTEIHLYIDNAYQGKIHVGSDGSWQDEIKAALDDRAVTVRADQVTSEGKVTARAEVGFARASLDAPSAMARVTVEPGNSLWRIARRTYGDGFDYVIIYRANKNQIRDPDLIYPGQVFMLPKRHDEE